MGTAWSRPQALGGRWGTEQIQGERGTFQGLSKVWLPCRDVCNLCKPAISFPRQMSTGMGTTVGDEVAPEAPQPTHIDVHIHQDPLLLSFLRQTSGPETPTPSQPLGSKRVLLGNKRVLVASWVSRAAGGGVGAVPRVPVSGKGRHLLLVRRSLLARLSLQRT